jgi:hypothetical protein
MNLSQQDFFLWEQFHPSVIPAKAGIQILDHPVKPDDDNSVG